MTRFTRIISLLIWALTLAVPTGAVAETTTITAGVGPKALAINPVTNKVYVANYNINPYSVTVIDGLTNSATSVIDGRSPAAVAVNPVTNKAYVANFFTNTVTVIDGATNAFVTIQDPSAKGPASVAVNPETNRVYIANYSSRNVTVIDGATDAVTATVSLQNSAPVGVVPLICMALNPVTNMVYVTNYNDNSVTIIDGATNTPTNVSVGVHPWGVAVNPTTGLVYVSNFNADSVSVLDGATKSVTATVPVGPFPKALAVNPLTNKIYVISYASVGSVTIINGVSNATTSVAVGTNPVALTVNPALNRVYVANEMSNNVSVIDGVTETLLVNVGAGAKPTAVAVNMLTNTVYVANNGPLDPTTSPAYGSVTVITDPTTQPSNLLPTSITPLPGNTTTSTTPTFGMTAGSSTGAPVRAVYYQVDSVQGTWQRAVPGGAGFSGTTPPLASGAHILYAFTTDGTDATSTMAGAQHSPLIGALASYAFTVSAVPPVTFTVTPVNTAHGTITPATQQVVPANTLVDFQVVPDNGYQLVSVTGCGGAMVDASTYRTAPVTADCTVTPTFSTNLMPVRIGSSYYPDLVTAYAQAPAGAVMQAMATIFAGGFFLNRSGIDITLLGGYDVTYGSRTGMTVVQGVLTVSAGSLVADGVVIQ